jgi:uncharacterized protein YbaR (Trm112 family)
MGKWFKRLFKLGFLAGVVAAGYRLYEWYLETSRQRETGAEPARPEEPPAISGYEVDLSKLGGEVSQELLDILVCPLDKGPLELVDGKWLVNRRNGYRYPIVDGIPVMLIEVGEKYKDESLITEQPATD